MNKYFILNVEQVSCFNDAKLELFDKHKPDAFTTDFCLLSNIYIDEEEYSDFYEDGNILHYSNYWVDGDLSTEKATINECGYLEITYSQFLWAGCRPCVYYHMVNSDCTPLFMNSNGILECSFGEYPQFIASDDEIRILESLYDKNELKKTGKTYTCSNQNSTLENLANVVYDEYELLGCKYIRVTSYEDSHFTLSNGEKIKKGESYWIKVEPIVWLYDKSSDILLSKYIIFTGIPLEVKRQYDCNFNDSFLKIYLNTQFAKDIILSSKNEIELKFNEQNKINDWIKWSCENNIHPVIHVFMVITGETYLNRDIDWIEISNRLYKSKNIFNLNNYLENDVFNHLCNVYGSLNISLDDVLNNNINDEFIKSLSNVKKCLFLALLTLIDESDLKYVKEFIEDKLGKKYIKYYDRLYELCSIKVEENFITKLKNI